MNKIIMMIGILLSTCLVACEYEPTSDEIQRAGQEKLSKESAREVGMPAIVNFQEKRMLKMIYELRDTAIKTIAYTQDMNGHLHKLCDSVGYGVPAATQYTNPQRFERWGGSGGYTLPQADPNGLFSPPSAEGTWVLCYDAGAKKMAPVYVEPRVIVSPFVLREGM